MKLLAFAIFLMIGVFARAESHQLPSTANVAITNSVLKLMEEIRIPKFTANSSPAREVLARIRCISNLESPQNGLNWLVTGGDLIEQNISLTLKDCSLKTVLDSFCEKTGFYWWITSQCVVVGSRPDYIPKKAQQGAAANP